MLGEIVFKDGGDARLRLGFGLPLKRAFQAVGVDRGGELSGFFLPSPFDCLLPHLLDQVGVKLALANEALKRALGWRQIRAAQWLDDLPGQTLLFVEILIVVKLEIGIGKCSAGRRRGVRRARLFELPCLLDQGVHPQRFFQPPLLG